MSSLFASGSSVYAAAGTNAPLEEVGLCALLPASTDLLDRWLRCVLA